MTPPQYRCPGCEQHPCDCTCEFRAPRILIEGGSYRRIGQPWVREGIHIWIGRRGIHLWRSWPFVEFDRV